MHCVREFRNRVHFSCVYSPVRQYALVSAENTPISFEFSNEVRVAILIQFVCN
jgi:hypothetical protein